MREAGGARQRDRAGGRGQHHRLRAIRRSFCWWKKHAKATTSRSGSPFGSAPHPPARPPAPTLTLEKKLVWEQEEQILDVAMLGPRMLVLSPSGISLRGDTATQSSVPLTPARPWPRDLRGHLRVNGGGFKAYLPGVACSGVLEPTLTLECHPSDEPWTLDAGSRGVLLASFVAGRNHFDGRVFTANGIRKTLGPFFSAASAEESGRPYWLVAMLDGRTQILDAALDPVGSVASWGSDVAGTEAHCGGRLADSGDQGRRCARARRGARLRAGKPVARPALRAA